MMFERFGLDEGEMDEGVGGHFSFLGFFFRTAHNDFACSLDGTTNDSFAYALVSREAEEAVFPARYYWLLLEESGLTRRLFGVMVRRIAALPVATG